MTISPPGAYPPYHLPPRDVPRAPPSNLGDWLDLAQGAIILGFAFIIVLIAMHATLSLLLAAIL